ncbi:RNA dependent RNA polymerase domain-containing protein [Hirsutella rhossiliensis]|uniref:RNA-dependent RNA polymerase n=1 Tax=Hirsutella rhossiliensis TaxID=111463 RepID=A0A9P8N346_9HYPO|nr:RNA dependent RNA polymerase domain-containing protein [Hirsutella rhossiliensis]KAH0966032.1 RNA dependent RNA polymerase domain-containing protein [Hirsutella rhossiliensis]
MLVANPTEDELVRIIGGLNENYGLGIRNLNPHLSPSKRRRLAQTEDEARVDAIYHRIRFLHFNRGDQLSSCLGKFRTEAHRAQRRSVWQSFGVTGSGPQSSAASLQGRLLDILSDGPPLARTKPPKRLSDEASISQAKRPKSRENGLVDELPVRSRISPPGCRPPPGASPRPDETIHSYFPPTSTSTSMQTNGLSKSSLADNVFSTGQASALASSDTTLDDDFLDQAADAYPMSNEQYQAFAELLAKYDAHPGRHIDSFFNPRAPQGLEQRLRITWPKQPVPGLNEAPLAVIWEVTRFLQHCGVGAAEYELTYEPNQQWHNQTSLRAMHVNQGPFCGKGLPVRSEEQAYTLALDGFQSDVKAVTLSAELVPRSSDTGSFYEFRLNPLRLELGHRLNRRFGADRFLEIVMPSPLSSQEELASYKQNTNCAERIIRWLTASTHYFLGRHWTPFFTREFKKTCQSAAGKSQYLQRVYFFASDGNIFRMPDPRSGVPPLQEARTPNRRSKMPLHRLLDWAIEIQRNSKKPIPKLFARLALSLSRTWPTVVLKRHQILCRDRDVGTHETMNDGIGRMSRSLARKVATCLGLTYVPSGYQARIGSAKGMWIIDVEDDGLEEDDWIEIYPSQTKWDCAFEDPHHRCFEQFIPVLEEQAWDRGAMRRAIKEHLENGLVAELDAQTAALGHPADLRLWLRQTGGSRTGNVFHGVVPCLAGLPRTDEEAIAFLLDAGFHHRQLKYIQTLLFDLAKKRAEQLKTKTHVKVPHSAYMFMVADFTSTLEEGEGKKSLATMLSGGDFDGDRCWLTWDRNIVDNFRNAPVPECPDLFERGYLKKLDLTVEDIGAGQRSDDEISVKFVYIGLLFNMRPSLLGQCTKYKEKLCYKRNTVGDGAAIILSHLVSHLVDQSKQGIIFEMDDWDKLRRDFHWPSRLDNPHYSEDRIPDHNRMNGGNHILDFLKFEVAEKVIQRALTTFSEEVFSPGGENFDIDLTKMYNRFDERGKTSELVKQLLKGLRKDIDAVLETWRQRLSRKEEGESDYATKVKEVWEMWLNIKPAEELMSSELVQMLMEDSKSDLGQWNLLKASATFKYHWNHIKFTWRMAARQLCFLKVMQTEVAGEAAVAIVQPAMWASLRPDKNFITARSAQREAARENDSVVAVEEVMEYDDDGLAMDDV